MRARGGVKRPTFRPKEGWTTRNFNCRVDPSIILASFTARVDGLTEEDVLQHDEKSRRGTRPHLVLKPLAVRPLFRLSAARAPGIADLLRGPLNFDAWTGSPSDITLDHRLRSGAFAGLLDRVLTLRAIHFEKNTLAVDSTGFHEHREKTRTWNSHRKKRPKGLREAHSTVSWTRR